MVKIKTILILLVCFQLLSCTTADSNPKDNLMNFTCDECIHPTTKDESGTIILYLPYYKTNVTDRYINYISDELDVWVSFRGDICAGNDCEISMECVKCIKEYIVEKEGEEFYYSLIDSTCSEIYYK